MTLEKQIERKLKKEIEKLGGMCVKTVWPGTRGAPDRTAYMQKGKSHLIETKCKNGVPSAIQKIIHEKLNRLGFKIWIISDDQQLKQFIDEIRTA